MLKVTQQSCHDTLELVLFSKSMTALRGWMYLDKQTVDRRNPSVDCCAL